MKAKRGGKGPARAGAAPAKGARKPARKPAGKAAGKRVPAAAPRPRPRPAAPRPAPGAPPAPATDALGPLLALSHQMVSARSEPELCAAVSAALDALYPGRAHAIRLVDPVTLALTAFRARGPLRPGAREGLALRRATLEQEGVYVPALEAAGLRLAEADVPLFEESAEVRAVPLSVGGALHGVVNVEARAGVALEPAGDGQVLAQLASTAALGVRNLRSIEELASLKGYLEDLIEHANALIAVVDRGGVVTVWNGALTRLTGATRAEAVGRPLAAFVAEEDHPAAAALLSRTLAGEAVDGAELRLAVVGSVEGRAAFNTAPIRGPGGEVAGVIAIGQDLTRLRSLEAAAEQAEKMAGLGRLAAGIVHELNNPLTAVTMYADALYEKWALGGGAPADVEKLKAIKDAGQRILKLARDLTTYARPSAARPEPVDLATLLDQAAQMCKPALKEADAQVEKAYQPAPQVVVARAAVVQALVNVIANAAQAAPRGGKVRLALSAAGGRVLATVADGGPGMAPEVLARAFEPFFTTKSGKGIGLGLPIARGIIERHGGTISLHSEEGQGTTVIVSLPAKPA